MTMRAIALMLTAVLLPRSAPGQDLEPKAYSASPVGTAFVVVGIARSSGSVLTDPTLPMFIGLFGGVAAFGAVGMFVGPAIVVLVLALARFAEESRERTEVIA